MPRETVDRSSTAPAWRGALDLVTTILMIGVAIAVLWRSLTIPTKAEARAPTIRIPSSPIALEGRPEMGSESARVALLVASDFQCPFCAHFATSTLPALLTRYVTTGQVQLFFLINPLDMHPLAPKAAEAALCANEQNQFWSFHDRLFAQPQDLTAVSLARSAEATGLDVAAFQACVNGRMSERVAADRSLAKELGMQVTPSFLFGIVNAGAKSLIVLKTMAGAGSIDEFVTLLDGLIARYPSGANSTAATGR